MKVINVHERELESDSAKIGSLIDSLASVGDRLWPVLAWPRMKFDRPLGVGATGGHGPIKYFVEEYNPGKSIKFRFTGPGGFHGFHAFDILVSPGQRAILRHTLQMDAHGPALLSWPLIFRPMHDALLEDSLATAQASLGESVQIRRWSLWVQTLRWVISRGRMRSQMIRSDAPGQQTIAPIWFYWLLLMVLGIMVAGISMILLPAQIRGLFSLLLYSSAESVDLSFPQSAVDYITLVHGVLGAVMVGWGSALLMILLGPFRRGERHGLHTISISIALWFVPDTLFSFWTGFWQNGVLNGVIALCFAIPLVAIYKEFGSRGGRDHG